MNRVSGLLVLLAAASLVADNSWGWAAAIVVGSLIVAYLVHGLAYRRAIVEESESRDPRTGEYLLGSTPQERMERARLWIDRKGRR